MDSPALQCILAAASWLKPTQDVRRQAKSLPKKKKSNNLNTYSVNTPGQILEIFPQAEAFGEYCAVLISTSDFIAREFLGITVKIAAAPIINPKLQT